MTSGFNDYMTGAEPNGPSLSKPRDQYSRHAQRVSSQQPAPSYVQPMSCNSQCHTYQVPYPHYRYLPYQSYNDQYIQQYIQQSTIKHMAPVLSPAETNVFVSDGIRWNEVNHEKVSPDRFLAKNLPAGGHNWEYDCPLVV